MINGAAVAPSGRIFASLPHWLDRPTPGVAEVLPDGSLRPFPGYGWNEHTAQTRQADCFVVVHSIYADPYNRLWVVDDAAPQQTRDESARPKLVVIDLESNKVERVFLLDIEVALRGTVLGHVRADRHHAYVTDSAYGAIIVVDRATGQARRILSGHPKTQADRSILPMIDGQPFQKADGSSIVINANLVEILNE
jgi:Major royal jelly protein